MITAKCVATTAPCDIAVTVSMSGCVSQIRGNVMLVAAVAACLRRFTSQSIVIYAVKQIVRLGDDFLYQQ